MVNGQSIWLSLAWSWPSSQDGVTTWRAKQTQAISNGSILGAMINSKISMTRKSGRKHTGGRRKMRHRMTLKVSKLTIISAQSAALSGFLGCITVVSARDAFTKWTTIAHGQIIVWAIWTSKAFSFSCSTPSCFAFTSHSWWVMSLGVMTRNSSHLFSSSLSLVNKEFPWKWFKPSPLITRTAT